MIAIVECMRWKIYDHLFDYAESMQVMQNKVQDVIQDHANEEIMVLEYDHVITCGTSGSNSDLLSNDIPYYHTARGGKTTYHGPGQRVIYPIISLSSYNRKRDLKLYVSFLEKWIQTTLSKFGISSIISSENSFAKNVGVWIDHNGVLKKIASIGVRAKKWVVFHGIAVNISCDLSYFDKIIPCGIKECHMTSMLDCGVKINNQDFDQVLISSFNEMCTMLVN
jgi:lipoyl(octanoyl) transferase